MEVEKVTKRPFMRDLKLQAERVYGLLASGIEPDDLHHHEALDGSHVGEQMVWGVRLAWWWAYLEGKPWDVRWGIPGVRPGEMPMPY